MTYASPSFQPDTELATALKSFVNIDALHVS
jgi:hypothetical protein